MFNQVSEYRLFSDEIAHCPLLHPSLGLAITPFPYVFSSKISVSGLPRKHFNSARYSVSHGGVIPGDLHGDKIMENHAEDS